MPRQLPWKSGGGSRTQTVKPSTRPLKTTQIQDDIDDDFFNGIGFVGSNERKGEANAVSDSDTSLPRLDAESTSRAQRGKKHDSKQRATSSSPAPLEDATTLYSEPMRKGASKFDLRDDEWMMVEDEFLETAKLFTRHLHIAEYDRLKEAIEAKKKEVEIARPVVAGAERSVEGAMRERAKAQDRKQKAIRDVFASQGDSSEDDRASRRTKPKKAPLTMKPRPASDTDSDDLDAPRPLKPRIATPTISEHQPTPPPRPETLSFVRPAPRPAAAATKSRARPSKLTPFDMLDEYTPPKNAGSRENYYSRPASPNPSSRPISLPPARTVKPRQSLGSLDDWEATNNDGGVSKEIADRIAKRKAARAREGEGAQKKRATRLDDIPTFLF
ncbi:hypothetical protein OPT61_g7747 [Boeremia exigua]|uniref:Uncharacterized protein n=1 Tax=Boeremia exigua TaxID=749465 RepID=A0ACC2I1F3_9PLEO|nr:hypothetical protein OPT61_g7747 [Boeremia exigua]